MTAPRARSMALIVVCVAAVPAITLLLRDASPERCFHVFQTLWIAFLVLLIAAHVGAGRASAEQASYGPSRPQRWLLPLALACGALVYVNTLHLNFVSDDYT